MKKVLIVEDTLENLEAAKAFFSTISGYEFVYATNRKDAEELLPTADALLTDRSIPFVTDETMSNYRNLEFGESSYNSALETNGYDLLAQAVAKAIPVLMYTSHSSSNFFITLGDKELCRKALENKGDDNYDCNHRHEFTFIISLQAKRNSLGSNITKDKVSSWQMAWEELLKQM